MIETPQITQDHDAVDRHHPSHDSKERDPIRLGPGISEDDFGLWNVTRKSGLRPEKNERCSRHLAVNEKAREDTEIRDTRLRAVDCALRNLRASIADIPKMPNEPKPALTILRRALLAILLLGMIGTTGELLLVGHFEDLWQWTPLVSMVTSLVALGWHAIHRCAASVRVLQLTMMLFVLSGATGIVLHCRAKIEFKREVNPFLGGFDLFWEAMKSQAPPPLAPGAMIQMGLLGLAYTYRHPALEKSEGKESDQGDSK